MEKRLILEKVFNYNKKIGFNLKRTELKAVNFKYALQDNVITKQEYDFFFKN